MGNEFVERESRESRERESRDTKGHNNYIVYIIIIIIIIIIIKRAPSTWVYAASPGLSADLAAVVGLEFTIFRKISEKNSEKFRKIPENSGKFRLKPDLSDFYTAPYLPSTPYINPPDQNTSETTPTSLQSTKNSIF